MDEYVYPDAQVNPLSLPVLYPSYANPLQAREADGKRPSQSVIDKMA